MTISVLVVDDSALMRKYLRGILEEAGFQVDLARDGDEGIAKLKELQPDVITLDINMPVMDGLTALSHIMTDDPTPVVMVSSLTREGELATLEALAMGAVDFIHKPGGTVSINIKDVGPALVAKVEGAAQVRMRRRRKATAGRRVGADSPKPSFARSGRQGRAERTRFSAKPETPPSGAASARLFGRTQAEARSASEPEPSVRSPAVELVLIGSSTGGPSALEEILPGLPSSWPCPIVIAQHMPRNFTKVFSERLDGLCNMSVVEVARPVRLERGRIHIARGDADILITRRAGMLYGTSVPKGPQSIWSPSVGRMVESALQHIAPESLVGVQLTGMGNDGAEALAEVHRRGGRTIAESEDTATIYGMPRALVELGGASQVLPIERVGECMRHWVEA